MAKKVCYSLKSSGAVWTPPLFDHFVREYIPQASLFYSNYTSFADLRDRTVLLYRFGNPPYPARFHFVFSLSDPHTNSISLFGEDEPVRELESLINQHLPEFEKQK